MLISRSGVKYSLEGIGMRRIIAAVTFSLLLIGVWAGAAFASNWLGHTAGDDSTVTFRLVDFLGTEIHDAIHWNDFYNVEETDVSTTLAHTNDPREVVINDSDYGASGWSGIYTCLDLQGTVCESGKIKINHYYGPYDDEESRHLVCMEVGHAIGLDHSTDSSSCMKQGQWDATEFTSHDDSEVNSRY
jgi:hypothetical protein